MNEVDQLVEVTAVQRVPSAQDSDVGGEGGVADDLGDTIPVRTF